MNDLTIAQLKHTGRYHILDLEGYDLGREKVRKAMCGVIGSFKEGTHRRDKVTRLLGSGKVCSECQMIYNKPSCFQASNE